MPKDGYSNTSLVAGLTGGIGSGKSTCAGVFEVLGIPTYKADDRAKALYTEDDSLKQAVIALLGPDSYKDDVLNREFIGKAVFANADLLTALEKLVHPKVKADFQSWRSAHRSAPYVIREAAILIESGSHEDCDFIINVTADSEERVKRVTLRDGSTRTEVEDRMAKQMSDEERGKFSDFTIQTDTEQLVINQVEEIHKAILSKC